MAGKQPSNADLQKSILNLEASINGQYAKMSQLVEALRAQLEAKDNQVAHLTNESKLQREEINHLKFHLNNIQQAERGSNLRILGLSVPTEDIEALGPSKAIMKKVYDRLLKPVLTAAKAKNAIDTIPKFDNLLVSAHFAGKPTKDAQGRVLPAPILVKFANPDMRTVVLKHKKLSVPSPLASECAAGTKKFLLSEDLTKPNLEVFKSLIADPRVGTVWTIAGCARFVLAEDESKRVHKVSSPFLTVDKIIQNIC